MIAAAMAELQLVRAPAERVPENLVAEADAERGHVGVHERLCVVDGIRERRRIAGAVAEEHAVWPGREDLAGRRTRRIDADVAAMRTEPPHDVPLHPVVIRGDFQPAACALFRRDAELVGILGGPVKRFVRRHAAHKVGAFHFRDRIRARDERVGIRRVARADGAAHHAARAQLTRKRPRIDIGDRHDPVGDEVVAQRRLRPPVARHGRLVADDEAGHMRLARFDVSGRHAVVADFRAGHCDDLARIGRIRQDLLVAGEAGVEHHFAGRSSLCASRQPPMERAVFKCQNCLHAYLSNDAVTRARSPVDTRTDPTHR